MMARFEIADESGAREVVAFSRTYDEIADKLVEDAPVVLVVEVSEDGESYRLVADRLIRWDQRESLPEVAIAEFNLDDVNAHLLADFRSHVDELAGVTPLRLRVRSRDGTATYATDKIRIDKARLEELEATCPWLKTTLTIDRDSLLRDRNNGQPKFFGKQAPPPPANDVPF
jgi:DNA polymerase-3 subunit alpha